MVAIRITPAELLQRTQMQLGAALIEKQVLDETLERCAGVMTPEQLQMVGLMRPEAPEAAPEIADVEDAPAVEPLPSARKNGQSKEAVPA